MNMADKIFRVEVPQKTVTQIKGGRKQEREEKIFPGYVLVEMIMDGKAVAIGTPRFAAPEQMIGGEVTAAVDVHAIGRLADVAFRSNLPRSWLPTKAT